MVFADSFRASRGFAANGLQIMQVLLVRDFSGKQGVGAILEIIAVRRSFPARKHCKMQQPNCILLRQYTGKFGQHKLEVRLALIDIPTKDLKELESCLTHLAPSGLGSESRSSYRWNPTPLAYSGILRMRQSEYSAKRRSSSLSEEALENGGTSRAHTNISQHLFKPIFFCFSSCLPLQLPKRVSKKSTGKSKYFLFCTERHTVD